MFLVSLMAPPATWLPLEVRKISNRVLPAQKAWKWFIYTPVLSMSDFSPRITKTEFFPMKKQTKGTKTKQKQAWNFLLTAFVFSGYLSDNICFLLLSSWRLRIFSLSHARDKTKKHFSYYLRCYQDCQNLNFLLNCWWFQFLY